ncbi:MAG: O-antigen ligase family protein [Thermoanaerobaculia bacterium]
MPDDALGGVGGARGDSRPRRGRAHVRSSPGGGTRLTPARRGALTFGAAIVLSALAFGSFPGSTAPATSAVTLGLSAAGLALGFIRPRFAIPTLAFLVPLAPGLVRLSGDRTGAPVLAALALAVLGSALAGSLARGESSRLPPRLLSFAAAFLVLAALSAAASVARGETLYLLLRGRVDPLPVNALGMTAAERSHDAILTFLGLVLLLLALEVFTRFSRAPGDRDRLLLATAAGAAAAFGFAAVSRFTPLDLSFHPWSEMHRRAGTFTDPNALGVGIGLLVPVLFGAAVRRSPSTGAARRTLAILALVAAPLALEASGSRTGLLLAGAGILAGAIGLARARLVSTRVALAALAALFVAGAAFVRVLPRGGGIAAGGLLQRLGAGLSSSSFAELANHRTLFWRTALEMTWDEPLSGIGLGGFPYEFPGAYGRRHGEISVTDGATNALLDVAAECGLPGLVLALGAVVPLLSRAWGAALAKTPLDPAARGAGAALLAFLVACQTGSHLRFTEIGLLTSLVATFLFVPCLEAPDPLPGEPEARAHVPGILAAAGILGAFVAVLPTARPSAPFRLGPWIGLYPPGRAPNPFRWGGPRVCREIRPGETSVSFRVENARPDGRPVTLGIDVDGRSEPPFELPGGSVRDLSVPVSQGARVLRLSGRPTFVPHELTGSSDFRRLLVRFAPGDPR